MEEVYNEQYFKSLNYSDYLSRANRYAKTAEDIDKLLGNFIPRRERSHFAILDYGGAVGFLCRGFKDLGYYYVTNCDVSEWARTEAHGNNAIVSISPEQLQAEFNKHGVQKYDLMTALDVFEHMTDKQICNLLEIVRPQLLIVRIPCAEDGDSDFHLEVSRRDKTHINCREKRDWDKFIIKNSKFTKCLPLNLITIYDSPGVYCRLFV